MMPIKVSATDASQCGAMQINKFKYIIKVESMWARALRGFIVFAWLAGVVKIMCVHVSWITTIINFFFNSLFMSSSQFWSCTLAVFTQIQKRRRRKNPLSLSWSLKLALSVWCAKLLHKWKKFDRITSVCVCVCAIFSSRLLISKTLSSVSENKKLSLYHSWNKLMTLSKYVNYKLYSPRKPFNYVTKV